MIYKGKKKCNREESTERKVSMKRLVQERKEKVDKKSGINISE